MNLLLSCIGRRGYIADWFREHLDPGDRIIGTSNTRWTPGFDACDLAVLVPDVRSEEYVPKVLELCRSERVDALLSFFDVDIDTLAPHRERFLEIGVTPVIPESRVSRISLDKLETARFLTEVGLPTPLTYATLEEARSALAEGTIRYPVYVKPRLGYASQNLAVARSDDELMTLFGRVPDMIIQEHLTGQEHSFDVLNDLEGRVVSVIVKRKVLMRAGETDQAETVANPRALEIGKALGRALRHVGPLDVDLFIDGDRVSILELNPRFGGGYPVSHLAGADFPRKILEMVRGRSVPPSFGDYRVGVQMMKDYRIVPGYAGQLRDMQS